MVEQKKGFYRAIRFLLIFAILMSGILIPWPEVKAAQSPLTLIVLSQNQIKLSWIDNLTNEKNYRIERKTDSGFFVEIASMVAYRTECEYVDANVVPGRTYTYRILSSDTSNKLTVHTDEVAANTNVITRPASLSFEKISSKQIDLKWNYPANTNLSTLVERKTSWSGSWEKLVVLPAGVTSYSDTGLVEGGLYFYKVRAVYSPNVYSMAEPDEYTGKWTYTTLGQPSNLYGYAASPTQVYIMWTDNSNETYFALERKTGNTGNYTQVAYIPANTTYWLDSGLTANTRYIYRIKAVTGSASSEYSEELTVVTTPLTAPSNLTAKATSDTEVELVWNDNSTTELGFEIWRKTGFQAQWEMHAEVGRNVKRYVDTDLTPDTQYFYKVRGHISYKDVYSAFTGEASTWTVGLIAPSGLEASILTNTSIELEWLDNSNNESGFSVERRLGADGKWVQIATLPRNSTEYTDKSLSANVQYFYRVKVFDDVYYNTSAYSEEIDVTTGIPAPPSDLSYEWVSSSRIKLVWSDNSSNETGFIVERRSLSSTYQEVGRTDANAVCFLDMGLRAGTTYYYRVRAVNRTVNSNFTKETRVVTVRAVTFRDIRNHAWAKEAIEDLASRQVLQRNPDGLFNPDEKISRGEFIHILMKAFKLNSVAVGSYNDVNSKHRYYREIMNASKLGIVTGEPGNYFLPDNPVTREDAAVFVYRTLKVLERPMPAWDTSMLDEFADKDMISDYAVPCVVPAIGEQILMGRTVKGKRMIEPKGSVTRAEAAVMIYSVIDR